MEALSRLFAQARRVDPDPVTGPLDPRIRLLGNTDKYRSSLGGDLRKRHLAHR